MLISGCRHGCNSFLIRRAARTRAKHENAVVRVQPKIVTQHSWIMDSSTLLAYLARPRSQHTACCSRQNRRSCGLHLGRCSHTGPWRCNEKSPARAPSDENTVAFVDGLCLRDCWMELVTELGARGQARHNAPDYCSLAGRCGDR